MTFPIGIAQSFVHAIQRLGQQITSLFRPGPGLRTPDFLLDIRRRVDAFFAGLTGSPQMAPQPLDQTGTPPLQPPHTQLPFKERHRTRREEEAPSPVIVSFPNPTQDEAVKKAPKPEAPREEARATVATVTVEERRTKHVVTAPPPAGRRPAQLKKRAAEKDLFQRTQAVRHENSPKELRHPHRPRPNRAEQGAPPPSDITEATGNKKKRGRLQRSVGQVVRKRVVVHKKATKSPAAVAAQPTPVAARRHRLKPVVRSHRTPNQKIDAWQSKKPKYAKALAGRIGSPKYTYLSVLRSARKRGSAHLHHTALNLIQHFRSTAGDKDWQQEARRVLSAEVTAGKSAGDQRLLHGLKRLAAHFETYAKSNTPGVQDLRALGKLITELQQIGNQATTLSELKDAAVQAFRRKLDTLKGDEFLLGRGELAELAAKAMQKGHQDQRELAGKLLQFQASDYPADEKIADDFKTVAESKPSEMTREQAYAACRLAKAFLKEAYDFEHQGSSFLKRYDETALAFLNETGGLLAGRQVEELVRFRDVRDLYVDGLATIPLKSAVELTSTDRRDVASVVSLVVQDLLKSRNSTRSFSDDARQVFEKYFESFEDDVQSFLKTMGAKIE
jgi:hypothetical protein